MKKKLFATIGLVFGAVLICLAVVADLNGKWGGILKTPGGDMPVTYTFKVDGKKLTGEAANEQGSIPINEGKVDGKNFTFTVEYNGTVLKNVGKYYGDSVTVDI